MSYISEVLINDTKYCIKDAIAYSDFLDIRDIILKDEALYYFDNVTVSVGENTEILRITNTDISTDTVVLKCTFNNNSCITSDAITWTSYDGYLVLNGSCTSTTTANIILGNKVN